MQGVGFRVLGFGCRIHGTQAFTAHEPEQSLAVLVGGALVRYMLVTRKFHASYMTAQ